MADTEAKKMKLDGEIDGLNGPGKYSIYRSIKKTAP